MTAAGLMIGDFARRVRLPVSTLRYYDKIGLLVPSTVDPTTGYRRYTADQLPDAASIAHLRSVGVPPDNIRRVLAGGPSAASALLEERRRLSAEITRSRTALRRLDGFRSSLTAPAPEVDIVDLTRLQVATRAYLLPVDDLEFGLRAALLRLRSTLRRQPRQGAGAWGATLPLELTEHVSGFVFGPAPDPVDEEVDEEVDTAWLPAAGAVQVLHRGGPASLPHAYHAAFTALDYMGAVPTGPVIEEYAGFADSTAAGRGAIRLRIPYS